MRDFINRIGNALCLVREKFWASLEGKGKYCTLWGIGVNTIAIIPALKSHWQGALMPEGYMLQTIYFVAAGTILIILPSYMKISKDGLEIKD